MKISKTLLGAIALLGMTGIASAQTKIYITGSTAFRAATTAAITNALSGTVTTASTAALGSANAVTWTGGNVGGTPVTIKASFTGSGAGIQTVAGAPNFPVGFLPDGATGTANADPTNSNNPHENAVPDMCMSDVFQPTTLFSGTFGGVTYATLTDKVVGVVAFTFAASEGFPANENMTPQIAQTLFPAGIVPLSEFTGNDSDINTGVIATGRNADSGTRLTAMAETNVGVDTTLSQYMPTVTGAAAGNINGTVSSLALYPASVINGVHYGAGDGGESSGSSLRVYMTDTVSASAAQNVDPTLTGGYLVTYLGVSDFGSVSTHGAVALNYNGVPESSTAIEEGSYTFWGYEHLDYKSSLAGTKLSFATGLANQILGTQTGSANLAGNVAVSDMKVQRFGDGGTVSSLFH